MLFAVGRGSYRKHAFPVIYVDGTINVELGERSYPIVIGSDLLGGNFDLNDHLAGGDCLIVSNETVAPLYLDKLKANLASSDSRTVELPDGEEHKTVATANLVLDALVG